MHLGTIILCCSLAYAIALALEILGLRRRFAGHRISLLVATLVALVAHSSALIQSATSTSALPLSTSDWLLWAAWLLAIVYFAALFYLPRTPTGIVLLPIVVGL